MEGCMARIVQFKDIDLQHIELVGGKNASLGEMIKNLSNSGIQVPNGFAITTTAYKEYLATTKLDEQINQLLHGLDSENLQELEEVSQKIGQLIAQTPFSKEFIADITAAYAGLSDNGPASVAVRSSATAEDLPDTSFAGQQDTYLNIQGIENVIEAVRKVYISLFCTRAVAYRNHHNFDHTQVAISVGIQRMVRSDLGSSGVIFTLDTESGFDRVILITASYGLGEGIVQGAVNPDEFYVSKELLRKGKSAIVRKNLGTKKTKMIYRDGKGTIETVTSVPVSPQEQQQYCLTDAQILSLAEMAMKVERHYARQMDIEWGLDGVDQQLYLLQARPETVKSRQDNHTIKRFVLKAEAEIVAQGCSVGERIGRGLARRIVNPKQMNRMHTGEILVTDMTDPDWEPIMKRASAIVTNRGGRTCHAAIVARELGIPAVVGCGDTSQSITEGQALTVSCAGGETGYVYSGLLPYDVETIKLDKLPTLPFKLCMNLGNPEKAFSYQAIPNDGVGLARLEFIINNMIGIHPRAILEYDQLPAELKQKIKAKSSCYNSAIEYYIERIKEGVSTIAAAFYPKPVIVRFSDFKSNEYANLLGGLLYEPKEENPMIGYRGASRYLSQQFKGCFELECLAIKKVREEMGLTNTQVMVPFVRTVEEARDVTKLIDQFGLPRSEDLQIYMMCEIPSNALLAEEFLEYFDGFSIGSNDLTQLTLGLDRDSNLVSNLFDERNEAVKKLLGQVISCCLANNKYIGICGQAPSDRFDFAQWLVSEGISAMSFSPDSIIQTWSKFAEFYR